MSVLLENEGYHGDRDLVDIPESGEPIYDEPLDADTEFARTLHRIWQEKGDFSKVSSNSLLEEQLNESKAVDNQSEPEEEPQADESLSVNDVLKLKQSVLTNLGDAQNELAVALDVVNLLLSNTPRHENEEMQLPVPKHSIGASAIDSAEPTPAQALRKSKIAITTKNESLQSAANIFDRASEQTDQVNKQNLRFWEDCLLLRDRNWTLIPSNGKTDPATDLERSAKDIKVLYAVEEASNEIKHESIASFDIKPSPSSSSTLNTGKRRSKRLKVSIRRGNSVETSSAGCSSDAATSASAAGDGNESLLRSLNDAQDASFDEDLFASLLTESNHIPIVITSSAELIAIELDTHTQLVLELLSDCDPKEGEQQSKHCDILLLGIKLLHLKNYEKKSATTKQALKQLLDLLHYDAFTKSIESLLRRTTALLSYMEVREADCCIQRTHAREILDIFVHHKSLQNITSQGFVRYGKHKITNISLSSPHTVFVQLDKGLQRTTLSQLKTLVCSDALTAVLNALLAICFNLSKRFWWVDEIEKCLVGKTADDYVSIYPAITETGCDISLFRNKDKTSAFAVDCSRLESNAALKDWLVRNIT